MRNLISYRAFIVAAVAGAVACQSRSPPGAATAPASNSDKPPATRVASPTVRGPSGEAAHVEVRFEKGHTSLHSSGADEVTYLLILEGTARREVKLERFSFGYMAISTVRLRPVADATFQLSFAPDGHALAVAASSETQARYVALDTGDAPMACGAGSAGTLAAVPSLTTAAVLEGSLGPSPRYHCALDGAIRFACRHRDSSALWAKLAAVVGSANIVDEQRYPLLECLHEVARADASVRAVLVAALTTANGDVQRGQVAEALAGDEDAATQDGLAEALQPLLAQSLNPSEKCWLRAKLSWSLASVSTRRKQGTPKARAALAQVARAPDACPTEIAGRGARIYGVAGLAATGERKALEELARPACDGALPNAPAFHQWNEAFVDGDVAIACHARAALARH